LTRLVRLHLGLRGCSLSTGDARCLCVGIADNITGLRRLVLDLRANDIGLSSTESPFLPLRRLTSIRVLDLDLSDNQLRPCVVEGTLFATASLPHLGSLRLAMARHAVYTDCGLLSFADRLTRLRLDLSGCRVNCHRLACLSRISSLTSVSLDVTDCDAGDVVTAAVAHLHACVRLQDAELLLGGNSITAEGLVALQSLHLCARLGVLRLDVSNNPLGEGALVALLVRRAVGQQPP
jgi:hypothetical protein